MTKALLDPEQTFRSFTLDPRLHKAISRLGLVRPTLVQSKCLALWERDLLVQAPTGSGKTLAFAIPVVQKVLHKGKAVVLVPTRDLCAQVHKVITQLLYYCDEIDAVLLTSKDDERQQAMLRDDPAIIVATPAALLSYPKLSEIDLLVIDEADLVLSMGYQKDVQAVVRALPRIFQGMLLSATLSSQLEELKKLVLHSPVAIQVEDNVRQEAGKLKQFYLAVPRNDKNLVMYVFLKLGLLKGKGLFFVRSTDAAYRLLLFWQLFGIRNAVVLNGELPFNSRCNIIEQFNVGNFDYLIATDDPTKTDYGVSRGLDFRNVSFVVNVDFPSTPESYSHRIGRTARGGAKGVALSLVVQDDNEQWEALGAVQEDQPRLKSAVSTDQLQAEASEDPVQPQPLDFDLKEIEGFRYRVEDVQRAVTKSTVRQARANAVKAELVERIDLNPQDLQLLQQDKSTQIDTIEHLKHVPKYLLPRGMQVAKMNRKRKKKKVRQVGKASKDPLQTFEAPEGEEEDEDDPYAEFMEDDTEEQPETKKPKLFANTHDGTGKSTSGRQAWKEKHKKGAFSNRPRKGRRTKEPLGI